MPLVDGGRLDCLGSDSTSRFCSKVVPNKQRKRRWLIMGNAALEAAQSGVGQATLVAAVIVGFSVAYKLIRKVTG